MVTEAELVMNESARGEGQLMLNIDAKKASWRLHTGWLIQSMNNGLQRNDPTTFEGQPSRAQLGCEVCVASGWAIEAGV